jgi:hypothetical protein
MSEPALDPNQPVMLRELLAKEREQLESYGWVDRDAGVVRIPIERAIQIVAENGLPEWPQVGGQQPAELQPNEEEPP